jgi:hypothetical protein
VGKRPVRVHQDGDEIYVANHDIGAHLYEWGSIKTPPLAPLRRAARKAARLDEAPKGAR